MTKLALDPVQFESRASDAAKFLKSLANTHRLMILCQLGEREMAVGQLLKTTTLSQSALSQHLSVLRDEGLVGTRRSGQTIYYRITHPAASQLIATLASIFCPETD